MKTSLKIIIVAALVGLVIAAVTLKNRNQPTTATPAASAVEPALATVLPVAAKPLPKLLDLGATKCIPCKKMAPILEELKTTYAGRLEVEFIDVWQNPGAGKKYGIKLIPTQIFYDATGKELFRHEGFFGREDILGKWKELGVNLAGSK